ncbi:hypothetical protein AF72_04290 [Xylella taiwanensis]|uniref:Uncharacterized protein n=1 Tax=Xylella taiwanensis TaxID=1444770 RepID=Z9JM05_9GAMM|nr:hypothetical protein AF72_04290 [Xylella taiwanensis]
MLPLGGMFKAGQVDANDLWSSIPVAPDEYISQRLPVLVARMREQWSKNDHVKRYIDLCRRNIVGPRALLTKLSQTASAPLTEQDTPTSIGLSTKEVRHYSVIRAISALLPNASTADKATAAFEIECSDAAEKIYGQKSRRLMIPADVLNLAFSMTIPSEGPGSDIIATELHAASFIE